MIMGTECNGIETDEVQRRLGRGRREEQGVTGVVEKARFLFFLIFLIQCHVYKKIKDSKMQTKQIDQLLL